MVLLALLYAGTYYFSDVRPNPLGERPLGWLGWADQAEYTKSVRAFATGALKSGDFFYPPLYALFAAPFWWIVRDHPFFVPNMVYLLVAYGVLLTVARRFYGVLIPSAVAAVLLLAIPVMSLTQWVIPWTTSLQTALVSILILLFSKSEERSQPFSLKSRAEWAQFVGFFLVYGALTATRPLDMVVWFPFALVFFLRTLVATVRSAPKGRRVLAAAACAVAAGLSGSLMVALYLGFNLTIHHSLFGIYGNVAGSMGYFPADVGEKVVSLFSDSGVVYGEDGQGLFQKLPLFEIIFSVCLVTLAFARDIRVWIILTAFFNFIIYAPYGDLLPTGFFRYYNLHYFKWAYPWLAVIAAGQIALWLAGARTKRRNWLPLGASAALALVGFGVGIRPANQLDVMDSRSVAQRLVTVAVPSRREVEYVDIRGMSGGFTDFYFGAHELTVDGVPAPTSTYRLLPLSDGGRLLFLRPRTLNKVELRPMANIVIKPEPQRSTFASIGLGLTCRVQPCAVLPVVTPVADAAGKRVDLDFRLGGTLPPTPLDDWWGGEDWGRWSRGASARLDFAVKATGPITVATNAAPLLGGARTVGSVKLLVNGCKIAEQTYRTSEMQQLAGQVPGHCLRPDGALRVEWRTDAKTRPVDLHINNDTRTIGVGVRDLTLRLAP